jgi:hypothetical protein
MKKQRFNWAIWAGFILSVIAFLSYPVLFVKWAITRDFPWASLVLFCIVAGLLFVGLRRGFAVARPRRSKIAATILGTLSVLIFGLFIFMAFIGARWLPASKGAPQTGQKAPAFSLLDTNGKTVSLADLLSAPIEGKPPRGVLLIFYRGYW